MLKICFISFDHEMYILRWLKNAEVAGLPDPNKQQNAEMKSVVAAANDAVIGLYSVVSKKRGKYASYDQCIHAKIGLTGKSAKLKCSEFST